MNILQLISSGGFFGAENVVVHLSSELQKIDSFYPIAGVLGNLQNPHTEVADMCHQEGIETAIFPCRSKFDFRTISRLRSFIKKRDIDVIHSHGYKANLYSFFSSLGLQTFCVATCHNWLGDSLRMKSYAVLDRFFLKSFNAIAAVSEDVRKKIINSGINPKKVKIIENGISMDRFSRNYSLDKIRTELNIAGDSIVIGTVGRISYEKGQEDLLKIVPEIVKEFPKTVFLIIGDGSLMKYLQKQYNHPRIIFTGLRNDTPKLYQSMDIFVLPSLTEGLPMVLLEAMASSLPVIATKVGAIPTVVQNGETGLVVEPGDPEEISTALLYLLSNPDKAEQMGRKGYKRVKEHYSSSKMAAEYINIYSTLFDME